MGRGQGRGARCARLSRPFDLTIRDAMACERSSMPRGARPSPLPSPRRTGEREDDRRRSMFNRYEQVLLIYLRQWQLWAYVGAWIAMFPLLDVLPSWWQRLMAFVFMSLAATGPAAVIGDAKQQIADARASLTPGFRGPHVVVAVALSLAAILLMPLLTHRALSVPLLGLTASVAICACALANLAYFQSITSVAVSMAATALLLPPTIREVGFAMLMGERNRSAVAVLTVASAILTWIF